MTSRREFVQLLGLAGLSVGLTTPELAFAQEQELPKLDYDYAELEPYIDAETMKVHHTKHHQAYIDGMKKASTEIANARTAGNYDLIQFWSAKYTFNAGGHFLHSLFWKSLAPVSKSGRPSGKLLDLINRDFGSLDKFKEHFSAAALNVEGGGWGVLHYSQAEQKLVVLQIESQNKLSSWGVTPILVLDVWEHAYYLKYKNVRKDYISNWWNVVNWKNVENMLSLVA